MNRAEQRALSAYLRATAGYMGLHDWHLDVLFVDEVPKGGLPHDDEWRGTAAASPIPGMRRANIYFLHDFRYDLTAAEQREVVVHELMHCHLADMREFVRQGILNMVAQQTYDAISFGFDMAWEHAVDAVARAWAERLPTIRWPRARA